MSENLGRNEISALGYLVVRAADTKDWRDFCRSILGMQVVDLGGGEMAARMDERCQRLLVTDDLPDAAYAVGWEVPDRSALERLAARLEDAGVAVRREPDSLAQKRFVEQLVSFQDPMGNRIEAFFGPQAAAESFKPGRAISGFRTGALGLGHVVLTTRDIEKALVFYRGILGFGLSDFQKRPFGAYFLHVNQRHHSLALIESDKIGIHHLMVEVKMLDDMGQCYDLLVDNPGQVGVTVGRHSNDHMISFYANSPGGFMVEYGWGGRDIDPSTWQPSKLDHGPSFWGHERSWLSPELRAEAKSARLNAAKLGMGAPLNVLPGSYNVCPGDLGNLKTETKS